MIHLSCASVAALLLLSVEASAWNGAGHMTVAAIAYRQLSPADRATVDELLQHHPAAAAWDADRVKHHSTLEAGKYRFLRASKWPDDVKRKRGWPNRSSWHYADFAMIGPSSPMGEDPGAKHNILVGLRESEATLQDARAGPEERAIALSWLLHLVGDLHQPLHCASAVTKVHPDGDRGGNETLVEIRGHGVKLHVVWDDLLGKSKDPDDADDQAVELLQRMPAAGVKAGGSELEWARESWRLAQETAYLAGTWTATNDAAIPVSQAYLVAAKAAGERQAVAGGVRLAEVLRRR